MIRGCTSFKSNGGQLRWEPSPVIYVNDAKMFDPMD